MTIIFNKNILINVRIWYDVVPLEKSLSNIWAREKWKK